MGNYYLLYQNWYCVNCHQLMEGHCLNTQCSWLYCKHCRKVVDPKTQRHFYFRETL